MPAMSAASSRSLATSQKPARLANAQKSSSPALRLPSDAAGRARCFGCRPRELFMPCMLPGTSRSLIRKEKPWE